MTTREELAALRRERDQLRTALASRILIEQAKGALFARHRLTIDEAFAVLRSAARRSRVTLDALAAEVLQSQTTPASVQHEVRKVRAGAM